MERPPNIPKGDLQKLEAGSWKLEVRGWKKSFNAEL